MSDRRRSAIPSTLHARGRHALPWLRRSWTNRWKVLLAPAILGAALLISPAFGTTYTVCASGCAFTSIQAAIDDAGTQAGDTISLAGETYAEAVTINKQVTLVGVGSSTVIDPPDGLNAITITGSGANAGSRLIVKDLKVTGAEDGIYVATGDNSPISYITLDGITATANNNNGINFNNGNTITDVLIDNSTITSNGDGNALKGNTGVRIATNVPTVTGFVLEDSTISLNRGSAFSYNPSGTLGKEATGVYLRRLTIANNVTGFNGNSHDISIAGWGSTSSMYLSDITVTLGGSASSSLHGHGIVFQGKGNNTVADWQGAGTISLTNITVTGSVPKTALYFLRFSTVTGVSLTNVDISAVSAGWGNQMAVELPTGCGLDIGTTTLKTLGMSTTAGRTCQVTATSAVFKNASTGAVLDRSLLADNYMIEDQVLHSVDVAGLGFLRWKANNVYVTPASYLSPLTTAPSIQRGIDAASSGDTVSVKAGSYTESPTISGKAITLKGAKAGVPAGPYASPAGRDVDAAGGYTGETVLNGTLYVSGSATAGTIIDGLVVTTTGNSIQLWQQANATTVRNCILTGRTLLASSGTAAGIEKQSTAETGVNPYVFQNNWISGGRYGFSLNEDKDLTTYLIDGNYVTGAERAVQTQASSVGTYTITNNLIQGVTAGIRMARDGATIVGNTIRNLTGSNTTQAAIRVDVTTTAVPAYSSILLSRGITITNNLISGSDYGVVLEKATSGQTYAVTANRFGSYTQSSVRTVNSVAGTAVTATGNYWGADSGPVLGQIDAADGATIDTSSHLTSNAAALLFPGFWPVATASEPTVAVASTADAPPVAAAVDLGGGQQVYVVLDFGAIDTSGTVTVTESDTPTDGSVSFGGNTVIDIDFSGVFTPPVKVCLTYDDSMFPAGTTPALWHYEETAPGSGTYAWVALETVSIDTENKVLCSLAYSFSAFAPGIAATDACDVTSNVLTVTIPEDGDVTVSRSGSTLTVTFAPGTECAASPITIGPDESSGQIDTLALVGDVGDETVTFETATPTNWGANSTSSLARTVDLGSGTGDLVILEGTSSGDTITASAIASAFTNVESLQLEGLAGNDILTAGTTPDSLYGGAGTDTLKGGDGADTLYGGDDNDSLQGGAGTDCADYSAETDPLTVDLTTGTGSGGAAVDSDTYASVECVKGGSGNDTLNGSAYADTLYGNGGSDTLRGRGGADTLNGGTGTGDTVTYAEQTYAVTVNLTAGTATGQTAGSDTITLVENVIGGTVGDLIVGDSNANTLNGGSGNDTLVGMQGDDTFTGGAGTDTVTYDDVTYGAGAATSGLGLGAGFASGSPQNTIGAGTDTINSDIENLTGSSYADTLRGTSGVNTINGLGGTDTIYGGAGIDTLNGGADGDNVYGQAGADSIRGGSEADVLYGGADADTLFGDAGNDTLQGGSGGDTLRGGDDNDTLVGGAALVSGVTIAGVDIFYGDAGTDTVSYDNTYFSSTSADGDYLAASSAVTFKLNAVGIQQTTNGAGIDVAGDLIENLDGSSYDDVLVGNTLVNRIRGLGGGDTIQGGDGNDTLEGGAGANRVEGQGGTGDTCSSTGGTYVYGWPKTCEIAG